MFWKKKPAATVPPVNPPAVAPASTPSPGKHPTKEFIEKLPADLRQELARDNPDTLTVSIGMIKAGAQELIPKWFGMFVQAEIYGVSIEAPRPEAAFVLGPTDDRNYLAVFTRRDLAEQLRKQYPYLQHIVPTTGREWLRVAQAGGRGMMINLLNEACSMKLPPAAVAELYLKAGPAVPAEPPVIKTPAADEPPVIAPPMAKPVRLGIGPSPWTWENRSHTVEGRRYRFRAQEIDGKPSPVIAILNDQDECLLLLGFHSYGRLLDDGTCLLWWRKQGKAGHVLEFRCFRLNSLRAMADREAVARGLLKEGGNVAGLPECDVFVYESAVLAGRHPVVAPASFAKFEETLALGLYQPENPQPGHERHAIFAFDWVGRQVEVIPQDWFNQGSYDFEYAWIARVARLANGKIVGDGVRLGRFELDATGRQIGRWIEQADGYMLS